MFLIPKFMNLQSAYIYSILSTFIRVYFMKWYKCIFVTKMLSKATCPSG